MSAETHPPKARATWLSVPGQINHEALSRSSHTASLLPPNTVYLFGGELNPREPVPNLLTTFTISATAEGILKDVKTLESSSSPPAARVGHTAASLGETLYIFGGRGGAAMTALDEQGTLSAFNSRTLKWTSIIPSDPTNVPAPRSYHAMAADEKSETLFIHAGCGSDGKRLSDVWAFSLRSKTWKRLADAPAPNRGGPSLTFANGKLWRFGGFDGTSELGGQIDYLPFSHSDNEERKWCTIPVAEDGPRPRSLAALHSIETAIGDEYLILAFGERSPSSKGHAGAGSFWDDIWSAKMSSPHLWSKVDVETTENIRGRGWFGSCATLNNQGLIIWGGLNEDNQRLGDGWLVQFE